VRAECYHSDIIQVTWQPSASITASVIPVYFAVAGPRFVLGESPAPRAHSGRRRRRAEGVAGKKWLCISYPSDATGWPAYVQRALYDYLQCGILAHGFVRLGCDTCHKELLLVFSCKQRGFCPSCAGRRMVQTAAYLVEQVMPWVSTRQ